MTRHGPLKVLIDYLAQAPEGEAVCSDDAIDVLAARLAPAMDLSSARRPRSTAPGVSPLGTTAPSSGPVTARQSRCTRLTFVDSAHARQEGTASNLLA